MPRAGVATPGQSRGIAPGAYGRKATLAQRPRHRKLELFESQIADDPVCLLGNSASSAFIICARIQPTKPASNIVSPLAQNARPDRARLNANGSVEHSCAVAPLGARGPGAKRPTPIVEGIARGGGNPPTSNRGSSR